MNDNLQPVRIWDLPTRAFHWSLAACVTGSIISAYIGGNAMVWHLRLGYAVFTLLAFRVLWGFAGGRWSRFANFIYSPATVLRYLRGQSRAHEHHEAGHNPLGALSVFGLLALLAAQVGTGLFADDEIIAFADIAPQAPVHLLIVPKRHLPHLFAIPAAAATDAEEPALLGRMTTVATGLARAAGFAHQGFRLVMNCLAGAGQSVFHIHLHLLGGRSLGWPPG